MRENINFLPRRASITSRGPPSLFRRNHSNAKRLADDWLREGEMLAALWAACLTGSIDV
jgi:hypothetical protein